MNDLLRPDILAAVAELSGLYPQWRFGQLVANVSGWLDQDIWDIEDEDLLRAIRRHIQSRSASVSVNPSSRPNTPMAKA